MYVAYQVNQADQSNNWSPSPVCVCEEVLPKEAVLNVLTAAGIGG